MFLAITLPKFESVILFLNCIRKLPSRTLSRLLINLRDWSNSVRTQYPSKREISVLCAKHDSLSNFPRGVSNDRWSKRHYKYYKEKYLLFATICNYEKRKIKPYDNSEIKKSSHHKLLTMKFDAKAIKINKYSHFMATILLHT